MSELIIKLTDRIDSVNVEEVREKVNAQIAEEHSAVVFDGDGLCYISSVGLRVLLKVINDEKKAGNEQVRFVNASPEVYDILATTGFDMLMDVTKAYRQLDVTGKEVIGQGFYGIVYRYDDDTIVKVYKGEDSIPLIMNEKKMAKLAFVKGIPTAISYDIVKVGDDYGSVFEMIRSSTYNQRIIDEPDNTDRIIREYVDLIKQIHSTEMEEGDIPEAKEIFMRYLYDLKDILSVAQIGMIRKLLVWLPKDLHVVHGDLQMKNVMISDGEPMIIDMDTLSSGSPIFDLQALYVTYMAFNEDEPDNCEKFLGISAEMAVHIWNRIMEYYFDTKDPETLGKLEDKIRLLAYIRFMYILTKSDHKNSELYKIRIEHSIRHIEELLEKVEDLYLEI
ncbi:MAG: STAS domain-containing protein [Lachnospiraceae bacterium]|nr:STAS domain-containing protein [Lachnospiraceae bacterium]